MRIWIVTKGIYSDRSLVGAFSSEELAEAWIAKAVAQPSKFCGSDYEIWGECSLDDANETPRPLWTVYVQADSTDTMPPNEVGTSIDGKVSCDYDGSFAFDVPAESEDIAVKIAVDKRRQILALYGPDDAKGRTFDYATLAPIGFS